MPSWTDGRPTDRGDGGAQGAAPPASFIPAGGILTLVAGDKIMGSQRPTVVVPDRGGSMNPYASRSIRRLSLPLVLFTVLPECHGAKPRTASEPPAGFVVTAEQIQKSGARTVWEALQLNVPVVSFRGTTQSGEDLRIRRRGRS